MTLNRRQFLGSSLPLMALGAGGAAQAAGQAAAAPDHSGQLVLFTGDSLPRSPLGYASQLQTLLAQRDKVTDSYLAGGAVAELEAKFSALLGKEDTVFLPTGTLANHLAVRLLCGEARHALVQQESHLYRDESNAVTNLSGINLVPLAPGRAAPTLAETAAAIERAENGPYPIKVGAIALESPVRRAQGATLAPPLVAEIAQLARAKGIPMHLDGARLLLMSGLPGFTVKGYCAPFDTVYVSLYKYLNAPFGGVLSGSKPMMAKARALRHQFGASIYNGWEAALPALAALDGAEQRWSAVRAAADQLLAALDATPGYRVQRVGQGSNIAVLEIAPERLAGLEARLVQAQIRLRTPQDGKVELFFNETLLRRDTASLQAAFAA
jgi:threonine aldolase